MTPSAQADSEHYPSELRGPRGPSFLGVLNEKELRRLPV